MRSFVLSHSLTTERQAPTLCAAQHLVISLNSYTNCLTMPTSIPFRFYIYSWIFQCHSLRFCLFVYVALCNMQIGIHHEWRFGMKRLADVKWFCKILLNNAEISLKARSKSSSTRRHLHDHYYRPTFVKAHKSLFTARKREKWTRHCERSRSWSNGLRHQLMGRASIRWGSNGGKISNVAQCKIELSANILFNHFTI